MIKRYSGYQENKKWMDNSKLQTQIMYWAKNNSQPPTTLQSVKELRHSRGNLDFKTLCILAVW